VVDRLREMIVKRIEELFLCLRRDGRVLHECIRDVVGSHPVQQELVVRLILRFDLSTFEAGADEVPKCIADQRVKVLHVHDVDEFVLQMGLALREGDG